MLELDLLAPFQSADMSRGRWTMKKNLEEIRSEGFAALEARLGKAGMIRFLQQFKHGKGDYASSRRKWVDRTSIDAIRKLSVKLKNKTNDF